MFPNHIGCADEKYDPLGRYTLIFTKNQLWKIIRREIGRIFSSGKLKYMFPLIEHVSIQGRCTERRISVKRIFYH